MGSLVWTTPSALHFQINRVDVFGQDSYTTSFPKQDSDYASGCGYVDINVVDAGEDVFSGESFKQHLSIYDAMMTARAKGLTARLIAWPARDCIAVEIDDRGLGIPPGTLATLNDRLANPPEFDLADSDRLGLFVVSLLAARHGIKITLRGSPYGGISAVVLMPHRLVLEGDPASLPSTAAEPAAVGRPEGDRGSAGEAGVP